jgi:DNA-directed RNA polymerase specialized sigma24 family protein
VAGWQPMLEQVARERYPRLVAYGMLLTGSQAEAEDLVQDALVTTFGGRARFATVAEAEAYVRRAVASRFIDHGRRRTAERKALVKHGGHRRPDVVGPPVVGLAPEVERALGSLAPRERACVVLRHMEDLSVRETAHLLGLSEGAVKRYVADGVAALNMMLGTTAHVDVETVEVRRVSSRPASPGSGGKEVRRDA